MIDILMQFNTEIILISLKGNEVRFGNTLFGPKMTTIEGLKLDYSGVVREFPDLKDNKNWKLEAIGRFKDKIKSIDGEEAKAHYIINDLRKFGYVPKWKQVHGFRREIII